MSTRRPICFVATLALILSAGLFVPSSHAQGNVIQYLSPGSPSGFLGIQMDEVTEDNISKYKLDEVEGVIVRSVVKGSPAESAGLMEDDVLLAFAGIRVRSTTQIKRLVQETPVGRKVELVISREGKRENVSAQLEEKQVDNPFERMQEYLEAPGQWARPDGSIPRGAVPRTGSLGIEVQPLSEQFAETLGVPGKKGVLVSSVDEKSPSFGKLKAGDVIIQVDNRAIETPRELAGLVHRETGGSLTFNVIREKKEVMVTVDLAPEGGKGFRL